jgi:putative CocE/NonD family hydrolase
MTRTNETRYEVTIDKAVMVPMTDGTRLAADIYRPTAPGKFPAILERTPYNREESVILRTGTPQFFAERGFVFIVQDVRGRFGSEGTWYPFVDDGWGVNRDGYETIAWVAAQPWCNGKVATAGGSYAGQTQMLLAPTRPPALACCFIREAASDLARQWVYRGGAFEWAFGHDWNVRHTAFAMSRQVRLIDRIAGIEPRRFDHLPLMTGDIFADPFRWLRDTLAHPNDGRFWKPFNFEQQYDQVDVPIYHLAGWFDIFLDGSIRNFQGLQANGRSKATRAAQKLIIGPWTHGPSVNDPAFAQRVGDMDFGPNALLDFNAEHLRWYDHWLNGARNDVLAEPRVRYFLMGANEWRTTDSWPPPAKFRRWYLHSGSSGSAKSLNDGVLDTDEPSGSEPPDVYRYDPADPVPTVGGNTLYSGLRKTSTGEENPDFWITAGPRDQRSVEPRCLTYTSEPLTEDLDVVGAVSLLLYAESDCVDTDYVGKLTDVFPDGRSILVVDGILRARYRKSRKKPKLLRPGKVYRLTVDLWPTAWRFLAGHRLRVAVTSSNFPRWDRNLNVGQHPLTACAMQVATNAIHHDDKHPSCIKLPILVK